MRREIGDDGSFVEVSYEKKLRMNDKCYFGFSLSCEECQSLSSFMVKINLVGHSALGVCIVFITVSSCIGDVTFWCFSVCICKLGKRVITSQSCFEH